MKNKVLLVVVALVAAIAMITVVEATNSTKGSTVIRRNGVAMGEQWTVTWVASADTFYLPFTLDPSHKGNPHPYNLIIETQSVNGDSVSLAFGLMVGTDGVNWKTYTLGTDSTTYGTTNSGTMWKVSQLTILDTSFGGYTPRSQIICRSFTANGVSYNRAGTKARVTLIDK